MSVILENPGVDLGLPQLKRDDLEPLARKYADNLYAQIGDSFAELGVESTQAFNQAVLGSRILSEDLRRIQKLVGTLVQVVETGKIPADDEIILQEEEEWEKILGTKVEVLPLPFWVTPEVRENLKSLGTKLVYIPRFNLNPDDLKRQSPDEYLNTLQTIYPNWRPLESLSDDEENDHSVVRNLDKLYWEVIKDGRIDFPNLPGRWMFVETIDKPNQNEQYPPTSLTKKMNAHKAPQQEEVDFTGRFGIIYNQVTEAKNRIKVEVLDEAGLDVNYQNKVDLRMLTTLEWNLLANRFGWGKTDSYEWVEDVYHQPFSGDLNPLVVGSSSSGGAGSCFGWRSPDIPRSDAGFRLTLVLEP